MALTALQLIRGSLRLIGEAGESETLSAEDADNCLVALNEMMEHWNSVPYMTFQTRIDLLSWPSTTISRTIGTPGGQFLIQRPIRLERGCFATPASGETELFVIDSRASYDRIRLKGQLATNVWAIYYDPGVPLGTLYLLGVPTAITPVNIASPALLQTFPTLNTLITLPEGYQECMRYNLAVELNPEFGGNNPIPPGVVEFAKMSMEMIQAQNRTRISGPVMANPIASQSP